VWSNPDWALYAVRGSPGLADSPARVSSVAPDEFTLEVPRPGSYLVRFHWNRYWQIGEGDACVAPDGDWTRVEARKAGRVRVNADFTLSGLVGGNGTCSG
jgi:hypothetical protein